MRLEIVSHAMVVYRHLDAISREAESDARVVVRVTCLVVDVGLGLS